MSGVLYVYAITDSLVRPTVRGLRGEPLRWLESGGLAGATSEHAVVPELDEEMLWEHEQVVESLMSVATILPLRFGSSVERAEALIAMLAERREEFMAALERVRGAVEISVRAEVSVVPVEEPHRPRTGTAYLLRRAEEERRERNAAELVHRPLAALARGCVPPASTRDPRQFKAAYLVEESGVEEFGNRVGELNTELEGVRVSSTGPWPPYSFVAEHSA